MVKLKAVTIVFALETQGERTAGYRFNHNPGHKDGNGWSLQFDETLRAIILTSDRTKATYMVPFEQCKYVQLDISSDERQFVPMDATKKAGRPAKSELAA